MYEKGRYVESATAFRELTRMDPASAEAWGGLGKSLLMLHNPAAIPTLARALQLKPGDPDLLRTLAQSYLETGNVAAAIGLLESLTESVPPDPEALFMLGEVMYRSGFYQRALQLLGHFLELRPENDGAKAMYAVSLAKVGRLTDAEIACVPLLAKSVPAWNLDVALTYVEILDETDRLNDAISYVDKVLYQYPQDPMAHFWKGRLLFQSGHLADAATEAGLSVTFAPGLPLGRNLLLQIYRRQGRADEAQRQADWLREYNDRLAAKAP
jgi:tetratricopeptide (TPR) repeat protein